jgi:hypothetical protein
MATHAYWVFLCKNCSTPIWLHLDRLGLPFEDQADLPTPIPSVAVACIACRRVEIYSPFPESRDYSHDGQVLLAEPRGNTVRLAFAQCEDKFCEARLPLFVDWPEGIKMPWVREQIESWDWKGLKCPNEHVLLRPDY